MTLPAHHNQKNGLLQQDNVQLEYLRDSSDARYNDNSVETKDSPDDFIQVDKSVLTRDTFRAVPASPLKRRRIPLLMLFLYAFLLLFFWTVTVILCSKPINGASWYTSYSSLSPCYYSDSGAGAGFGCQGGLKPLSKDQLAINDRWRRAVRLIGSITAVLAIPISSGICARAAVAYLQNRRNGTFKLSKALALADRGWWDPVIAGQLFLPRGRRMYASRYLLFATGVCALGALIFPLQELFLTQESIKLVIRVLNPSVLTPDADITGLYQVNSTDTISTTVAAINSGGYWDPQPNIWRTPDSMCNGSASWSLSCIKVGDEGSQDYYLLGNSTFVSYVANTANTGLVENHAFRFNSSVTCTSVTEDDFPRPCNGFSASSATNLSDADSDSGSLEFQVCAPGDARKFPWNITRNRQDIEEDVYLYFNAAAVSFLSNQTRNSSLTQRCTAQTTAGYFLLPNQNSSSFGPLLDEFDLAASYDPKMEFPLYGTLPSNPTADIVLGEAYPVPNGTDSPALGPLLTSTISLFGPSTFFSTRANATASNTASQSSDDCTDAVPFYYISTADQMGDTPTREIIPFEPMRSCASTSSSAYFKDLNTWLLDLFLDPTGSSANNIFTQALFYANKANLARAASVRYCRRTILADPGTEAQKLDMHPAAVIVISVIIALHLGGLVSLAFYAAKFPTWTETLDSFAVLRIGSQLDINRPESRELLRSDPRSSPVA